MKAQSQIDPIYLYLYGAADFSSDGEIILE